MKNLLLVLLLTPFISCTQTLSVGNNQTHTTSGDNSYSNISIGNNGLLHIVNTDSIYSAGDITSSNGIGITVDAGAILHADGSLVGNNSIQLNISGKLTLGSVNINNNGTLTISGTGELNILGDLTAENGTSIDIDFAGTLDVGGNVVIDEATSTANVNGNFVIGGTYSGPAFTGDGTVTESGTIVYPVELPVDFLGMEVECSNGGYNTVTWKTASESNSDYFVLERSRDGIHWTEITELKAAGTSNKENHYTHYDLGAGRYFEGYYQLTQVDYDGKFKIYDPVSVQCNKEAEYQVAVYPNPVTDKMLVTVYSLKSSHIEIDLTNLSGQILTQREFELKKGMNVFEFDLASYKKGLYIIYVKDEEHFQSLSVSKK
jgi:hypothetical protein